MQRGWLVTLAGASGVTGTTDVVCGTIVAGSAAGSGPNFDG
jgi:hypothetical protein